MSEFSIKNHRLIGPVTYHNTKKTSGEITPKFLVIHYTAGSSFQNDVATLSTSSVQASCHLVIGPKGEVAQIGKLNANLWHAGKSSWRGYTNLNSYSIGIEVSCPGPVEMIDDQGNIATIKYWWGKTATVPKNTLVYAPPRNGGKAQWWVQFTPEQIEKVIDIGLLLMHHYGLQEAVGHDQIAPDRKIDPGPCCPQNVFDILNGRVTNDAFDPATPTLGMATVANTNYEGLNFRDAPNGRVTGLLPDGTVVEVLREDGNWAQVRTPAGYVGWVFRKYLI